MEVELKISRAQKWTQNQEDTWRNVRQNDQVVNGVNLFGDFLSLDNVDNGKEGRKYTKDVSPSDVLLARVFFFSSTVKAGKEATHNGNNWTYYFVDSHLLKGDQSIDHDYDSTEAWE